MPNHNKQTVLNPEVSRRLYLQGAAGAGMAGVMGVQPASADVSMSGYNHYGGFDDKMESGDPLYGMSDPFKGMDTAAVISNHPAVDWVWIDAEHGSYWIEDIRAKLTVFPDDTAGIVRIPGGNSKEVAQVLDAGADGVIIPKPRSVDEIKEYVQQAYYPPDGTRGVAGTAASLFGQTFDEYRRTINDEVFVIVQIETIDIVNQIDEVAQIDGISSLLIGPTDLSYSLGNPLDFETTEFQQATNQVLQAAKQNDIMPGYWIGSRDESVFVDAGWRVLSLGSGAGLMMNGISNRFPEPE